MILDMVVLNDADLLRSGHLLISCAYNALSLDLLTAPICSKESVAMMSRIALCEHVASRRSQSHWNPYHTRPLALEKTQHRQDVGTSFPGLEMRSIPLIPSCHILSVWSPCTGPREFFMPRLPAALGFVRGEWIANSKP